MKDVFKPGEFLMGDWNADCSMCGRTFKGTQLIKCYTGMWRCRDCWEPRPTADYGSALPVPEKSPLFIQDPREIEVEVSVNICTLQGRSAIAGMAMAGCAIVARGLVG